METEIETKDWWRNLPPVPVELEEIALDQLGRYLIYYDLDKTRREATCTHCCRSMIAEKGDSGEFGNLREAKHNEKGFCPCCGHEIRYIAEGRMRNFASINKQYQNFVFVWAEGHDRVWMLAAYGRTHITHGHLESEFNYIPVQAWLLEPGKASSVKYQYINPYNGLRAPAERWTYLCNPHRGDIFPQFMGYGSGYSLISSGESTSDVRDSFMRYAIEAGNSADLGWDTLMIAAAAEYPSLFEMLLKLGANWALNDKVYRKAENKRLLDWSAESPADFFRLDKASFRVWQKDGCRKQVLELYHAGKKVKCWSMEAAVRLENEYKLDSICLVRAAKLLKVRIETVEARLKKKKYNLIEWSDYLKVAKELKYDLKNPVVVFPKHLKQAHDHATAQIAIKSDAKAEKEYRKRLNALSHRYCYCDGEFFIRPPFGQGEIIREGKLMNHCVGTYAEKHMKGKTDILFMRRCDAPDTPLYTIEYTGDYERQIRGKQNSMVKKESEKAFHERWLGWVAAGSKPADKPKIERYNGKEEIA